MASWKVLVSFLAVIAVGLLLLAVDQAEAHHGPMLIFKMGKRRGGGGGGGGLATLLAAGAVAKLLQHGGAGMSMGRSSYSHSAEPMMVSVPMHMQHGGMMMHGGGGGMMHGGGGYGMQGMSSMGMVDWW